MTEASRRLSSHAAGRAQGVARSREGALSRGGAARAADPRTMQAPVARSPVDAMVAAGCVAVAMLLTSLASFAFEEIQGWPIVSMVAMCIGLLSISIDMTCAAGQQGNYSSAMGLCGGNLLLLWLKWFASASVTSSFAVTATAWRSGTPVPPASLWLSLASTFCALLSWWWWQCSDGSKANSRSGPTPTVAKLIGAVLSIGLLLCLVTALFSSTDAAVGSSTAPAVAPQPAASAQVAPPPPPPPVLTSAAGPSPAPIPLPEQSLAPTSADGVQADRNATGTLQPTAAKGMSDGVVAAGVVGCAVAMIGVTGLAFSKEGGARRLLGSKPSEASYGGNRDGDQLSRGLSAEVSTANPVQGATATEV